jgi:tRNA-splicing ligase RtcB
MASARPPGIPAYIQDLLWAQDFARANRDEMMDRVMTMLSFVFCNEMKHGQFGVIPGSMGTRSYTVSGLENDMAFHSALHGASRRLSCGEAKRRFTMKDFEQQMKGGEEALGAGIWAEIALPWGVLAHHELQPAVRHSIRQLPSHPLACHVRFR